MPFTAWLAVSEVGGAVWVLDTAIDVVSRGVVAGVATVVSSDVAVGRRGSECARRGWGLGWGVVGRLGSVCRCFRGVGSRFGAGDGLVVVVVDDVGNSV
jgi:hypothetical protein